MLDFLPREQKAHDCRMVIVTARDHARFRGEMRGLVHDDNAFVLKENVFFGQLKGDVVWLFFKEKFFFINEHGDARARVHSERGNAHLPPVHTHAPRHDEPAEFRIRHRRAKQARKLRTEQVVKRT